MIRYYWEALFSIEYFPYWEFTMCCIVFMIISIIIRLAKIRRLLDDIIEWIKEEEEYNE